MALMFDGPSLGGFVCPATITSAQLWKMGQVQAKDAVVFKPLTLGAACSPYSPSTLLVQQPCASICLLYAVLQSWTCCLLLQWPL